MGLQIEVECVLVKDGSHIIGVGLTASVLDEEAKGFCKKIFSTLEEKLPNEKIADVITLTDEKITFKSLKTVSFAIEQDDARALKQLLFGEGYPLDLRHYPFSDHDFKIVLGQMDAFSRDFPLEKA